VFFLIIAVLVVLFNVFLLIFPQIVLTAARDGLLLWFNNVLPSLLPFMIASNMLISLGFAKFLGDLLSPVMQKIFRLPGAAGFGLVTGLTSGYPMGAKAVADLKNSGELTTQEAQHLLAFCNNAGPVFILGVVGVGMFGSTQVGYVLWAAHIFAALFLGILLSIKSVKKEIVFVPVKENLIKYRKNRRSNMHSVGKILGDAVKNAMESMAIIGGLIIFFSVTVAVLETISQEIIGEGILLGIFAGLVEVTGGARRLAALEPSILTLASVAFVLAFGGFSVHAQTFHFTTGTGIKNGSYLLAKILHGALAAVFTILLWWVLRAF